MLPALARIADYPPPYADAQPELIMYHLNLKGRRDLRHYVRVLTPLRG